ncbi:MAG: DUF2059 domain-containing protein [Bacteroidota bacterium]
MKHLITICALSIWGLTFSFAQTEETYTQTLKTYFTVSGSMETYKTVITQTVDMYKSQGTYQLSDEEWDVLAEELMGASVDDLVELLVPVYQNHLTEADLQSIIEFYQSPVGKKLSVKTPLLAQESMQAGQAWGYKLGQRVAEKLMNKDE